MKKIISLVLSVGMLTAVLPAGIIYAEDIQVVSFEDYLPGETLPENLLDVDETASRTFTNRIVRNSTAVNGIKGTAWSEEAKCFAPQGLTALSDVPRITYQGYAGLVYKNYKFDKEKTYVFSVDVKADAGENVAVGVALTNEKAGTLSYSKEYGYDGMEVTDEYKKLAVTLIPAEGFENDAATHSVVIGFPEGVKKDSTVTFDTTKPDGVYLSEEVSWDIKNSILTKADDICQDSTVKLKAEVVNQVGQPGTLKQNFTWFAMNADKTEEVEGFSFSKNSDGTTNMKISEDVALGEYAIVAKSDDYEGFIKTVYINVLGRKIQDTEIEPEESPDNLILQPADKSFAEKTDSSVINVKNEDGFITVTALTDIENNKNMKMDGVKIRTALNKGFASDFRFTPGKTYVVSAEVRRSESSTADEVKFAIGFGQGTEDTFTTTNEYGIDGITLTDEWQEVKATIKISENYNPEESVRLFYLGMPDGTLKGSAFDLKLSAYIAEEILADVGVEVIAGDTIMTVDDETEFRMNLKNQLGITGSFAEGVKWFILNENRNNTVDFVNYSTNENTVKVVVDEFTPKGVYYITAESGSGETLIRKSMKFTVDNLPVAEFIAEMLKITTKDILSDKIKDYVEVLEINFVDGWDKDVLTEIILNSVPEETMGEEELKKFIKKAIAISLYANNSENVELYDKDGKFIYSEELFLADIDSDDVTINKVFEEILSADGKLALQKKLIDGKYEDIESFEKAFAENVILKAIEKPGVSGSGYIGEILTQQNAEFADVDIDRYMASKYKNQFNKALARKEFTKEKLEKAINEFKPTISSGGSGGGSSSGGGYGGVSVKPAETNVNVVTKPQKEPEEEKKEIIFLDVPEKHWAYADIYHLKARDIINGIDENIFAPDETVTREQFVKMLCTALKFDASFTESNYTDVDKDAWYANYINIAVEKKIVNGVSDNVFGIGRPIKRQDLCVIVYRALGVSEESDALTFKDSEEVADYAKNAVAYLNTYDIIKGFEDNTFRPNAYCTRAQAAKILCTILNMEGVAE